MTLTTEEKRKQANTGEGAMTLSAREKLEQGNKRFISNQLVATDKVFDARMQTKEAQHPFAMVLTCADSRVSPEWIFDQPPGQLFVVRNAGNQASDSTLMSFSYSINVLKVPYLLIMGHEKCGAIKEAPEKHKEAVLRNIDAQEKILQEAFPQPDLIIEKAFYELSSGTVVFL